MNSLLQAAALASILFLFPAVSHADIDIFSDISANPFGTGTALIGAGYGIPHEVLSGGPDFGDYQAWAASFTAPENSVASEIDVVLGLYAYVSNQGVIVDLYANSYDYIPCCDTFANDPGVLLASQNLTYPSKPTAPEQVQFPGVVLTQGQIYWVGVIPQSIGDGGYYWYSSGGTAPIALTVGSGDESAYPSPLVWDPASIPGHYPEFAVIGSPTPEPSYLGLICAGVAMLVGVKRHAWMIRRNLKRVGNI